MPAAVCGQVAWPVMCARAEQEKAHLGGRGPGFAGMRMVCGSELKQKQSETSVASTATSSGGRRPEGRRRNEGEAHGAHLLPGVDVDKVAEARKECGGR